MLTAVTVTLTIDPLTSKNGAAYNVLKLMLQVRLVSA